MIGVTAETGTPVYSERPGDVSVVSNYVSSRFKFNVVMPLRFLRKTMLKRTTGQNTTQKTWGQHSAPEIPAPLVKPDDLLLE
jgi:hypothetical protein